MHRPYPGELRTRVIDFVEGGGSRRGAAEQFEVSVLALTEDSQITKMVRVCEHEDAGMHLAVS